MLGVKKSGTLRSVLSAGAIFECNLFVQLYHLTILFCSSRGFLTNFTIQVLLEWLPFVTRVVESGLKTIDLLALGIWHPWSLHSKIKPRLPTNSWLFSYISKPSSSCFRLEHNCSVTAVVFVSASGTLLVKFLQRTGAVQCESFVVVGYRLDQTLGKPGAWMVSSTRERQRMTVIARLARIEIQVCQKHLSCNLNWDVSEWMEF